MVYRFQLKRNLKSLLLPALAVVLVLAAVAIIVFYQPLLGLIALAVAGYLSYHIVKFFMHTLRSNVQTSDEGMVCFTATGSESRLRWDQLSHAGWYEADGGYREFFVYAEEEDKLLTIPMQYEGMEELAAEVAERSGVKMLRFSGEDVDGLTELLRHHIAPEGEIIDEQESEDVPD